MKKERDYTDTIRFQEEYEELKKSGVSEEDLREYKKMMSNFDVWGNENGTNYSNVVIAYDTSKLG